MKLSKGIARKSRLEWFSLICCFGFCVLAKDAIGEPVDITEPIKTESQEKLDEKAKDEEAAGKAKVGGEISEGEIGQLVFPKDMTSLLTAKELRITGNTLITTEEIVSNIPLVFNTSSLPILEADSSDLYDFRTVREIIEMPGEGRQVSERTIIGLTRNILSLYKAKGYSGIYVEAVKDGARLQNDILTIKVTEASITSVTSTYFTPDNLVADEGYLKESFLQKWTPVKVGEVGKEKELGDFVNLLNLNPDRYISARVSKGAEPDTLAVGYGIYEANPWHYFVQVDNAGTDDRRYTPRVGLINTNLTGIDDRLTVYHQAPWEKDFEDRYSVYGSYNFPVMGPRLRLELFGGYSQFDVEGGAGIDFLGHGSQYGGELRYNLFQREGWFFDITTSLTHEESKVTSSIFSSILGSEVEMDLWGIGVDLHKRSDMFNSSVTFDRIESIGGSKQRKFWDPVALTGARTNADRDFAMYITTANHSKYLDTDKIQRLSGSVRWIVPDERLVPAKMTTFGGMYSVRGYKESAIIADGGLLASIQYEYDLIKRDAAEGTFRSSSDNKYELKKLAPLVFFDYGRAKIKDKVAGEDGSEDLYSVGVGALVEIGEHFSGAVYYGFPLEETTTTDDKDGRLNLSLMVRW